MSPMAQGMPEGPLIAWYGDDFTGSTDAMEALAAAGLPTLLCLEPPTVDLLHKLPGLRCIGLAGSSRGRSPAWMDAELPKAFDALAAFGAPVLHYKVCSTFDSSPDIGSIGRAITLGVRTMGGRWSPTIVGSPPLKRYQVFGNLFAAVDGVGHRLDRHPTMSRHPVTPMHEADLRLHLREQTSRRIELLDFVQLGAGTASTCLAQLQGEDTPVVFIDVLDDATLLEAGRLVWEARGDGIFSASSSGLSYALAAYWRSRGWLPASASLPVAGAVPVIAAVSGSCSPVTAGQIRWARANGFVTERLRLEGALAAESCSAEVERCVAVAAESLKAGHSVVVYSAEGPDDPSVTGFDAIAGLAGLSRGEAARRIGEALAQVMKRLLDRVSLERIVVAGGDSSGEVASALGIRALRVEAAMTPGAPLCRAISDRPQRDGLQLVLKGGQMGAPSFFGAVQAGRPIEAA